MGLALSERRRTIVESCWRKARPTLVTLRRSLSALISSSRAVGVAGRNGSSSDGLSRSCNAASLGANSLAKISASSAELERRAISREG